MGRPSLPFYPSLPLTVGPLNPARVWGSAVSSPASGGTYSIVWGKTPAEIGFDAF